MPKRITSVRNFNVVEYWDCVDIKTGLAVASVQETIPIPANSFVSAVVAQVLQRAESASGTVVLVAGDSLDTDGYLKEQTLKMDKNFIFGNDDEEAGVYLRVYEGEDTTHDKQDIVRPGYQILGKFHPTATNLIIKTTVATAAATIQGIVRVWAKITQLVNEE